MCGWWWTCGCLECAAFCKLFPSNTIHIPQLNCLWILGLWGKLECNWMCHASKYPIETALSVTSFCLHDPFPHFQLTIRFSVASNFHKITIVLFHLLCRPPFLTCIHAILIMLKYFHTHTHTAVNHVPPSRLLFLTKLTPWQTLPR